MPCEEHCHSSDTCYVCLCVSDDSTRVVLKPVSAVPGSDYINASRIDVSHCV